MAVTVRALLIVVLVSCPHHLSGLMQTFQHDKMMPEMKKMDKLLFNNIQFTRQYNHSDQNVAELGSISSIDGTKKHREVGLQDMVKEIEEFITPGMTAQHYRITAHPQGAEKENAMTICHPCNEIMKLSTSILTKVREILTNSLALPAEKSVCQYIHKFYKEKGLLKSSGHSDRVVKVEMAKSSTSLILHAVPHTSTFKLDSSINIPVSHIIYNCKSMILEVKTKPVGKFTLAQGLVDVAKTAITIRVSLKAKSKQLVYLGFESELTLQQLVVSVLVTYKPGEGELSVKTIAKASQTFNINEFIKKLAEVTLPLPLPSFTISDVMLTAKIYTSKGGNATLIFSGIINKHKFCFILQKATNIGSKFATAFGFDLPNFKFPDLFKKTSGVDISGIPFFGSLSIPKIRVTYASTNITSPLLATDFPKLFPLIKGPLQKIRQGLHALMDIKLEGMKIPLRLEYVKKLMNISVLKSGALRLRSLLLALGVRTDSLPIPPGIKYFLQLQIHSFSFDPTTGELDFYLHLPGKLTYFNEKLIIWNPAIHISATLKKPRKISVEVDGEIKLKHNRCKITIRKSEKGNGYLLHAAIEQISLRSITDTFSKSQVPPNLGFLEDTPFNHLKILKVRILFPMTMKPLRLHLSGVPVIHGIKTAHINILILKEGKHIEIIQGYQIQSVSIASIVKKLTGKLLSHIKFLQQHVDVAVVISPAKVQGVKLHGSMLESIPINKGVSVEAAIRWPTDCGADTFCAVVQRLIGKGAKLSLNAAITNRNNFKITVILPDINLQGAVFLSHAQLVINVGSSSTFQINADLTFPTGKASDISTDLAKTMDEFVIQVSVTYKSKEKLLFIKSATQNKFSVNINNVIKKLTGVTLPLPIPSFTFEHISLTATVNMSSYGGATLIISGSISGNRFYFVLQKKTGEKSEKYVVAFGAELSKFKLSTLLKKVAGVDISSIPFFGSLSFPELKLMYSFKNLTSQLFATTLPKGLLQHSSRDRIGAGLQVIMKLKIGSDAAPLHLKFLRGKPLTISALKEGSFKFLSLLSVIGIDVSTIPLPPGFKKFLSLGIQNIQLDPVTGKMELDLHLPEKLTFFDGKLTIMNVVIHISAILKKPREVFLDVQGEIKLDNKNIKIYINKSEESSKYIFHAEIDEISLLSVIRTFSGSSLPSRLKSLERSPFFQTKIVKVRLVFPMTKKPLQIHISGTPVIYGIKAAHISLLVLKQERNVRVIQGYQLQAVTLADILKKVIGKSPSTLSFLKQRISIAVIVSPITVQGVKLHGKMLEKLPITKGVLLEAKIKWPKKCSDGFCTLVQRVLGKGASINLKAKITSPDSFNITANLPNIKLSSGLTLSRVQLAINVSTTTVYGMQGDLIFSSSREQGAEINNYDEAHTMDAFLIKVSVTYKPKEDQLLIKSESQSTAPINIKHFIKQLTGLTLPLPIPSLTIEHISLVATVDMSKTGNTTMVLSGSVNRNRFYFVLQKPDSQPDNKYGLAFGAHLRKFKLSGLLKELLGMDISSIPFFGSLSVPDLQLTFATKNITSSLLSTSFPKGFLLQGTVDKIGKGFQALMRLEFGKHLVPLRLQVLKKSILTFSTKKGALNFRSLFSVVNIDVNSFPLPKGIRDFLHLGIQNFQLDTNTGELDLDLHLPRKLTYFNDRLTIWNPQIKIHAIVKKPRKFSLSVQGKFKVDKYNYQISIQKSTTGSYRGYVIRTAMDELSLLSLTKLFSGSGLPKALRFLEKTPLFKIKILHTKIAFPLSAKPLQIHISGIPVLFGLKTVHINILIIKIDKEIRVVQGYQLASVNLVDIVKKITGKNLEKVGFLQQQLHVAIIVSPITMEGVKLYGKFLENVPINKGLTVKADLRWPPNCKSDKICALAQRLVGKDATMTLLVTMKDFKSFRLAAQLANIRLGQKLILSHAGLVINVGATTDFGIEGELLLPKQGITFLAAVRIGSRGIVLQGSMKGCWNRAFGANWLSICNLHLLIGFQPTITGIGALEFGGEIRLGKCSPKVIAKGYIGLDQMSPKDNFYYVELEGPFTIQSVLHTFLCKNLNLPKPIADSGFPEGYLSSFSLTGKKIPHLNIHVPAGFRIKAKINILGLVGMVDMAINLPDGFRLHVEIGPLNIGGLLKMYASEHDHSRGPYLKVIMALRPQKRFEIDARGFVYVLGMSVEASLKVTSTHYEFYIRGKFLHLFEASLHITSSYGSLITANFRAEGHLRNDLYAKLREKITRILRKSAEEADKKISAAQSKIKRAKRYFDAVDHKLQAAQKKVMDAKGAFDSAIGRLKRLRRRMDNACHHRKCSSVCFGCFSGWKCVCELWKICCLKVPRWDGCCNRVRNPICVVANFACTVLKKGVQALIWVAEKVIKSSKVVLHIANIALYAARGVVAVAKHSLNIVIAALEVVKQLYKIGMQAAILIVKFGLGGLIDIRELYFNVALGAASSGEFSGRIKISFFGKPPVKLSFYINLHNIWAMVKQLAARIIPGLGKKIK